MKTMAMLVLALAVAGCQRDDSAHRRRVAALEAREHALRRDFEASRSALVIANYAVVVFGGCLAVTLYRLAVSRRRS